MRSVRESIMLLINEEILSMPGIIPTDATDRDETDFALASHVYRIRGSCFRLLNERP